MSELPKSELIQLDRNLYKMQVMLSSKIQQSKMMGLEAEGGLRSRRGREIMERH